MNSLSFSHVEILFGLISAVSIEDERGRRDLVENLGTTRFFVEAVQGDGTRVGMWDGVSYDDAILEAEALSQDLSCAAYDLVITGDGR